MVLTIYVKSNETKIICTYNDWNIFRKSVMKSFIGYLEEQIILEKYKSQHTKNEINDFISHYYETIDTDTINFDNFNKIFDNDYINLFILNNYYGFYVFITKDDYNSYFSVGNSYDMLTFFSLIDQYIDYNHKDTYDTFKLILMSSSENKKKVCIK